MSAIFAIYEKSDVKHGIGINRKDTKGGCQISFIGYTLKLFAYEKVLKGDINKHILKLGYY